VYPKSLAGNFGVHTMHCMYPEIMLILLELTIITTPTGKEIKT
jgi:hypothetical protein